MMKKFENNLVNSEIYRTFAVSKNKKKNNNP